MTSAQGRFQAYGEAVCAFLSHATRREKAAVRQELMDHLTDHAEALLDAGFLVDFDAVLFAGKSLPPILSHCFQTSYIINPFR